MDLHALFALFEKLGVTTLDGMRSVMASVGIHPSGIWCNHALLAAALKDLKPVATASGSAATATAVESYGNPAIQVVKAGIELLLPEILHFLESMEVRLGDVIAGHMDSVHRGISVALQTAATIARAPAPVAAHVPTAAAPASAPAPVLAPIPK